MGFVLAATLALKTFVPLLAAVSAQMQGKAVGDVCAVYGVRLAAAAPPSAAPPHHHHGHHAASMDGAMAGAQAALPTSHDTPSDHAEHARDHCALTGLAVCAVLAAAAWDVVDWAGTAAPSPGGAEDASPVRDASARWLTLRVHAPPSQA